MKYFYLLLIILLYSATVLGQNLEQLGVKQGVKATGSININTIGYAMRGIPLRRDPFNWFVTGNLNLNLFGYAAPFSFSYSNTERSYSQPFNQLSFAPQYKWVKTYIGFNSMTFSSYTLAGHVFLGGGVELSPGKWRVAAMYGRLQKPVLFNPADSLDNPNAAYRRMGYGLKAGYEGESGTIEVSVFGAKDDPQSLPWVLAESSLAPKRNLAVSLHARRQLGRFYAESEYGVSVLTTDTRAGQEDTIIHNGSNLLKGLIPITATTRYFDAFNGSVGYGGNWYTLALRYERVAPEFATLGAYFFNNDLENITLAPALRLLKGTLQLSANVGRQLNNLDKSRTSTTRRLVGSVNAVYTPSEQWNLSLSHSNFSTFTNVRPQTDPFFQNTLDTLNFYQVTGTSSATAGYSFGPKERRQGLVWSASYQQASEKAAYEDGTRLSDFYSANLSYSYALVPLQTSIAASLNYNNNRSPGAASRFWGPSLSLSRSILEKTLRTSLAGTYNRASTNGVAGSDVWNTRWTVGYTPKGGQTKGTAQKQNTSTGGHQLSFSVNMLRRFKGTPSSPGFTEWTATGGYTYSF